MELTWIDDFLTLARVMNFTKASEERFTTQPAFSRRIQRLENWLGVDLFDRDARPIQLTPSGKIFMNRIPQIRSDIMDIRRMVSVETTNMHDAQVIYTTNTLALGFLPLWIKNNKIKHYRLIVASVSTCIEAFKAQKAHYAIIPLMHDMTIRDYIKLGEDRLVFCAANHDDFKDGLNDFNKQSLLMYAPQTAYGLSVKKMLKDNNIVMDVNPACESASAEALMAMIRSGMGGGWVPETLVRDDEKQAYIVKSFPTINFDIVALRARDQIRD